MADSTTGSLERGLLILRAFRPGEAQLGNAELADRTGLAKSTVSRLTASLSATGFLQPTLGGRQQYRLGGAAMDLAGTFLAQRPVLDGAQAILDALAQDTECAIAIAERDRFEMLYLAYARPRTALALALERGARLPITTTASGRAWLAAASAAERDAILGAIERDGALTPAEQAATRDAMAQAVRDYADLGFTRAYGSWNPDVNAVAMPFRSAFDGTIYVLNAGGPAYFVPPNRMEAEVVPRLRAAVEALRGAGGRSGVEASA